MVEVDVIRRLIFKSHEEPLEVGPWGDDPKLVEVRTCTEGGEEYWGRLSIALSADEAEALGKVLIAAAADARLHGEKQ